MRSSLRTMRQHLGMKQQELATRVGVSRQTLSAIEAGSTVPSTLIALGLARVLRCRVEDLFSVEDESCNLRAWLAGEGTGRARASASAAASHKLRLALGQVGKEWVARPLDGDSTLALGTPADGIATLPREKTPLAKVRVRPLRDLEALLRNLFVAGCDPALGLLGRHLEERLHGPRLHWIDVASRAALEELAAGRVHIAGLHLGDMNAGNLNAATVRGRFGDAPMTLVTLAAWELGMVYRLRGGRSFRKVADLADKGTRVVGREPGAGARHLLESALARAGLKLADLDVVAIAHGHRAVAQMVAMKVGDVGIATRAVAVPFGLGFAPLAESRFDLAFHAESASDSRVQMLLECLTSGRFRKDLGAMTGYRTTHTGDTVPGAPE